MEYISAIEASEKWGVSLRQVQRLLAGHRIPHAKKYGRSWMIPRDAEKPADPRKEKKALGHSLSADVSRVFAATSAILPLPMPGGSPGEVPDAIGEERLRLIYEAELAYLRGDFARTMRCFEKTEGDDAVRLRVCPLAIAAAVSLGDYHAYTGIDVYLKRCIKAYPDGVIAAIAELSLATAAVSVIAPSMAPGWLIDGDLSALPPSARTNALYLRAKYFNCTGRFDAMLATAQAALSLSVSGEGFMTHDIYLRLMCAVACRYLERNEEARRWLLSAMRIALPHGLTTPFSELVTALGGLMEQCLEQEFPDLHDAVIHQWKRTWKNWITFHNQFTKDNITSILSLREYHIAVLVARRVPYAKIAKEYCISVGRLKNIMLEIYEKLYISGREELVKYIM
ncbi:Transcription regulator LuxR, C-terminal [Syntrophomonas zehnderi OL-4]|uniref:Transcription regulator LuxR, C-terminal n=2 Tax=Syntrophomonas TaxID=862 RepID=A0A0E3W2Q8_9FIRM|nr:Transcription regulator LuxR, C-terminal [Syntrophomonas zehnderi OL-4]